MRWYVVGVHFGSEQRYAIEPTREAAASMAWALVENDNDYPDRVEDEKGAIVIDRNTLSALMTEKK